MGKKDNLRENLKLCYLREMRSGIARIEQRTEDIHSGVRIIEESIDGIKKGEEELIEQLIEMGKRLSKNRDFDGSLEFYEKARKKYEGKNNNKLLLKITVGEAVCYTDKGNPSKALELLYSAEKIEPENPIVLSDIASILRTKEGAKEAESYAKKALKFDENNVLALTVLALLEYGEGNTADALALVRKASNIDEEDSYSKYTISFIYSKEGDFDKAIEFGLKAIGLEPSNPKYHNHLGRIFLMENVPEKDALRVNEYKELINLKGVQKAIDTFEKAIDLNHQQGNPHLNSEIYVNLGSAYFLKGVTEKSIFYYQKAIESGETCDAVYINLGNVYLMEKDYEKVIKIYEPLIEKGNKEVKVMGILGSAYIAENRLDEAELLFNELVLEHPKNKKVWISCAHICELKGEFNRGIEIIKEALEKIGSKWDLHYILGRLYLRVDIYDKSVEELKKSLEINEKAIEPRRELIDLYINLEMSQYAEKHVKELLKIDSKNKGFHFYKLAYIHYQLKSYGKAVHFLDMALNEGYATVGVHRLLSVSLLELGEMLKAKEAIDTALEEFPHDAELKNDFAALLFESRELDSAIEVLESSIQLNPKYIHAYLSLSNLYILKGEFESAIDICKKAIVVEPRNEDAHFRLALAFLHAGQINESSKELQSVREINPNTQYVRVLSLEEIKKFLEDRGRAWGEVLDFYRKGEITIGKAAEILKSDVVDLLNSLDNKKVSEELNFTKNEIVKLEDTCIVESNVVVDTTILGLLAQIGRLDLINGLFNEIFISKDIEEEILQGISKGNPIYRAIGENLETLKKGGIKVLNPKKETMDVLSRITPMASKNELSIMALALDNKFLYLTDDILLRSNLKKIDISFSGLIGILKYSVSRGILSENEGNILLQKFIENGYSPNVDSLY